MKTKSGHDYTLNEGIGHLINHAAWIVRSAFEAQLARYDVTAPQWTVLFRLWEEDGQAPSEICRRLFFDRPTMTGIIDRLEDRGLVTRRRDEKDRRVVRIYLTKKGSALKNKLPDVAFEVDQHTLKGLSANEIKVFSHCLKTVLKNFSE